mgnify:CR=1 FL=1
MGKTSLGLNIARHVAVTRGRKVAFFSLEMPREQLANRMLCGEAHVDMQSVRQGSLTDEDWLRLADALGPLAQSPIYFDDTSSITIPEMRSRCRRMQMEHGLDLIMVDYLQLMSSTGRNESRQNEVSDLSRQLKLLALELKIPIIVGSQLSRGAAQRQDHRPILSDLRDSGAIEQDADTVMFLHREDYYNPETEDKNIAEVIVAKQRNGPLAPSNWPGWASTRGLPACSKEQSKSMHTLVVAEKPSVARDIARVLGASARGEGRLTGGGYVVTWAIGHLVALKEPEELDERYRRWRAEDLPFCPSVCSSRYCPRPARSFPWSKSS